MTWWILLQCEPHGNEIVTLRLQTKSQLLSKSQHPNVLKESLPHEPLRAAPTAIVNQFLQKQRSQSLPFEIRAHQHREFRFDVVGIGVRPRHAEGLLSSALPCRYRDERHLPLVVKLRQMGEVSRRQLADAGKESRAHVF